MDTESEKRFLKAYRQSDYERPSVTADIALFKLSTQKPDSFRKDPIKKLSLLLVQRRAHPYQGCWALPGGFLRPDETIERCALRELTEETGVEPASLLSIGLFSAPGRDPRGWVISNAFVSVLGAQEERQRAGDDAADAQWFDVRLEAEGGRAMLELTHGTIQLHAVLREGKSQFGMMHYESTGQGELAFDHAAIIARAISALRNRARDFEMIFDFLPEKFTLTELQNVQEAVMNTSLLPANFRRKVAALVEETDEYTEGAGHRPAKLYRRKAD